MLTLVSGRAGSGKTTLLYNLMRGREKEVVLLRPTIGVGLESWRGQIRDTQSEKRLVLIDDFDAFTYDAATCGLLLWRSSLKLDTFAVIRSVETFGVLLRGSISNGHAICALVCFPDGEVLSLPAGDLTKALSLDNIKEYAGN